MYIIAVNQKNSPRKRTKLFPTLVQWVNVLFGFKYHVQVCGEFNISGVDYMCSVGTAL